MPKSIGNTDPSVVDTSPLEQNIFNLQQKTANITKDQQNQTLLFGGYKLKDISSNIVDDNEATTRGYNDSRYARLGESNTFTSNMTQYFDHVTVNGSLTLLGGTLTDYQTEVLISDQVIIDNSLGTFPSLIVNQKNTTGDSILQVKDDDVVVFQIGALGSITQNPTIDTIHT
jgi:hypothetical protein